MYGASFENHPDLVDRLACGRKLLGNTSDALRRVRDPLELMRVLRAGGFAFPETYWVDVGAGQVGQVGQVGQGGAGASPAPTWDVVGAGLAPARRWLWKPLAGGGGTHVVWADQISCRAGVMQQFIEGMPCSFAFVANGRQAQVIGLTEQLIGLSEFGASGFRWCGNLAPPRLEAESLRVMWTEAQAIADCLTAAFGLRGLNGVDFIWQAGCIWVIEANPRPSASLELFETPDGHPLFDLHVRGCLGKALPVIEPDLDLPAPARGKAVIFAVHNLTVGDTQEWARHDLCDIPLANEHILRGHPICTALAEADTAEQCLRRLHQQANLVRQWVTCD